MRWFIFCVTLWKESATSADSQAAYFGAPSTKLKTNSSLFIYLCQLVYLIPVFGEQIHFILTPKRVLSQPYFFSSEQLCLRSLRIVWKINTRVYKVALLLFDRIYETCFGSDFIFFSHLCCLFFSSRFISPASLPALRHSLAPPSLYGLVCNICVCCPSALDS